MNPKKVVIAGGPGTGKTSIIEHLKSLDFVCYDEISRQVTLQARKDGIEQLFLTEPLIFSEKLLEGRISQYENAQLERTSAVFIDRGLPDVLAYLDFIGDTYPQAFIDTCKLHTYDYIFVLAPWQEIFESDNERYENFEQALAIHNHLKRTYSDLGYTIIEVPTGTIQERTDFILSKLS